MPTVEVDNDIADPSLAGQGRARVEWADRSMPVLATIGRRFARTQPLRGLRVAACLHVTTETAILMRVLQAGGAAVRLCASNPLSTQDDTAAALVAEYGVSVFARSAVDRDGFYAHIDEAIATGPHLVLDDGCDLTTLLHDRPGLVAGVIGGCEETTTGVIRLRQMVRDGALAFPMVAVDDTATKRMFDNRYGTGQSTVDGLLRATNMLLAGRTVVVVGYGYCGRGVAQRVAGLGANVVVTEIDHSKALDATMQGFRVMPMLEAAAIGDVFVTVTGNRDVIGAEHFAVMKDGAVLANSGHFDVEIDVPALATMAEHVNRGVRPHTDEYVLGDGRRLCLLAEGRLVNLAAAEGHPAVVMDISFSEQALAIEWLVASAAGLAPGVHEVPAHIDAEVARLKLAAMGIRIDALTPAQENYLSSWAHGS
ncbi:MAG: adenosylhomocysteinase [Actinomycetota bacterium]|nr:adenosylhomocysteinase [Actinomycetota bacterium]